VNYVARKDAHEAISDPFVLSDDYRSISETLTSRRDADSLESFFQMLPIPHLNVFAAWKAFVTLALGLSLVSPGSA
jgi:hypothetical protein